MENPFYFSRKERYILAVATVIIVAVVGGRWLWEKSSTEDTAFYALQTDSAEVDSFMASVAENISSRPDTSSVFQPQVFDPNTCDSLTLIRFSLKPWQVRMFLKYRRAGAKFYNREDLMRVYSLHEDDVERMMPYARFPVDEHKLKAQMLQRERLLRDSAYEARRAQYPEKMKPGETVPLNLSDTTMLKGIPGVGSYYALKIRQYGERLGGYVSVSQLKEIEGLPENVQKWFKMDKVKVNQMKINKLDFKSLIRHPYLNYEQVKCIFNHRNKYGKLTSLMQLSTEPAFTADDLKRLEPYISFE